MTYRFRAKDAGTYSYHSHQQSDEQVQHGLTACGGSGSLPALRRGSGWSTPPTTPST
ncbi:multicopper oxidase domain-containing protein [Streptomyces sp. NPDC020607]|uniref:multicopper oxidase domain-containing protein n=1 Tax=Streptomyces sp. NPDC020607 TaxID=3365082 RepID=UPI0037876D89